MIRVFVLALLSLGALVLIARSLPPAPAVSAGAAEEPGSIEEWMGSREGVWEGVFRTFDAQGEPGESMTVRREHTSISPTEQDVVITDYLAGGVQRRWRGRIVAHPDGRIESRMWGSDGSVKVLAGIREGRAIRWSRIDSRADPEIEPPESFREEVIQTATGDLYTQDGAGLSGASHPGMLLFTGRYRRVAVPNP